MTAVGQLGSPARWHLYLLVSRLFVTEVDIALYDSILTHPEMEALFLPKGSSPTRELLPEEAVEVMAVEFCRLFVGPRPVCPPYASVQRGEALVGGRSARLLEEFMEARQLRLDALGRLPVLAADHLSIELALLALLYDYSAAGMALDDEDPMTSVRTLLQDHLLPWAPEYLSMLVAYAPMPPYQGLARLTLALLEEERELHSLA